MCGAFWCWLAAVHHPSGCYTLVVVSEVPPSTVKRLWVSRKALYKLNKLLLLLLKANYCYQENLRHPFVCRDVCKVEQAIALFLSLTLCSSPWMPLSRILAANWASVSCERRKGGCTATLWRRFLLPRYLETADIRTSADQGLHFQCWNVAT